MGGYIPIFRHHTGIEVQPLFTRLAYVLMYLTILLPSWLTDRTLRRRPGWGPVRGYLLAAVSGAASMFLMELHLIHVVGMYSWASVRAEFALWPGTWYQYAPLEVITFGFIFVGPLAMARRTSLASTTPHPFRGSPTVTGHSRTVLLFLAMNGFQNTLLLLWMLTLIAMSVDQDWPPAFPIGSAQRPPQAAPLDIGRLHQMADTVCHSGSGRQCNRAKSAQEPLPALLVQLRLTPNYLEVLSC